MSRLTPRSHWETMLKYLSGVQEKLQFGFKTRIQGRGKQDSATTERLGELEGDQQLSRVRVGKKADVLHHYKEKGVGYSILTCLGSWEGTGVCVGRGGFPDQ